MHGIHKFSYKKAVHLNNVPIFNISPIMTRFWYIMVGILFHVSFKKYFLVFTISSDSAEHDNKSYLHFNPPRVIHQSATNVHAAAAIGSKTVLNLGSEKVTCEKSATLHIPET